MQYSGGDYEGHGREHCDEGQRRPTHVSTPDQAPKGGAVADESRQVEAQTSPSTKGAAPANEPEVTSKGLTSDEAPASVTSVRCGHSRRPDCAGAQIARLPMGRRNSPQTRA
jgi:hypothetical protein